MKSYKITDNLYISNVVFGAEPDEKLVQPTVNHILVIDCSGSMSWDLPKIREQLKLKLPKLLSDNDTVSIIWFSGKGECGVLVEGEVVKGLKDLSDLNRSIDRWLKPVGLTGFKEPIALVGGLVDRLSKKNSNQNSLFFLTDGQDNQWSAKDILGEIDMISPKLSAATFVEYGYYCNRKLMADMAERSGGSLVFSEDFDRYSPAFDASISRRIGKPKVNKTLPVDPYGGFAFSVGDEFVLFSSNDKVISIPEDQSTVWFLSTSPIGKDDSIDDIAKAFASSPSVKLIPPMRAAYAALSIFGQKMCSDIVFPLLKSIGDVFFIEKFTNCFSKQQYSDFCDLAKSVSDDLSLAFKSGWDPTRVPRTDAFNVLELFDILSKDDQNRVLLDSDLFKYSRVSRGRVDSSSVLSDEEQQKVADLTTRIASEKQVKKIKELRAELDALLLSKPEPLKFEADLSPGGYSFLDLKWNEERPNLSFMVSKSGHVDLSGRLPETLKDRIPGVFPTRIFRNYAIVRDGLVNIENLPVSLSEKTIGLIQTAVSEGRCPADLVSETDGVTVLKLRSIPVVNRSMVSALSAKNLFEAEYQLIRSRAWQKVLNNQVTGLGVVKDLGMLAVYGEEATKWLREQGLTDSGFNPKMVQAESKDFYVGKELDVKVKGYSTLPSLKDLATQIQKNKLNGPGSLMKEALDYIETFKQSPEYVDSEDKAQALQNFVFNASKKETNNVRKSLFSKAQQVFSVIVGQTWFTEFSSLEDNSMVLDIEGNSVTFSVQLKEVEVKI
jgi:hypothetical protein